MYNVIYLLKIAQRVHPFYIFLYSKMKQTITVSVRLGLSLYSQCIYAHKGEYLNVIVLKVIVHIHCGSKLKHTCALKPVSGF